MDHPDYVRDSIIVVSMNDNLQYLQGCLDSIFAAPPKHAELVVMLNNYTQDAFDIVNARLRNTPLRTFVLHCTTPISFSRINNMGANCTSGPYLVLLNDDTVVPPGWLDKLHSGIHDDIVCVGPQCSDLDALGNHTWDESTKPIVDYVALCCAMIVRDVWDELGGLDEGLAPALFEDSDFGVRLIKAGYRSAQVELPGWEHLYNGTLRTYPEQEILSWRTANYQRFMQKHGDWLQNRKGQ